MKCKWKLLLNLRNSSLLRNHSEEVQVRRNQVSGKVNRGRNHVHLYVKKILLLRNMLKKSSELRWIQRILSARQNSTQWTRNSIRRSISRIWIRCQQLDLLQQHPIVVKEKYKYDCPLGFNMRQQLQILKYSPRPKSMRIKNTWINWVYLDTSTILICDRILRI